MKKLIVVLIVLFICGGIIALIPSKEIDYDYLRIHIKANSNVNVDQNVKFEIKDLIVGEFASKICTSASKQDVVEIVKKSVVDLKKKCDELLRKRGFNYSATINIVNEFFPSRKYDNTVLESGYYDAVVVNLGEGVGDNWWCVMYPPLCFVNKNENITQIKYKSVVCKWWNKVFAG